MTTPVAKKTIGSKVAPTKTVAPVVAPVKQCPPNPPVVPVAPVNPPLQPATVLLPVLEKKRGGGLTKEAKAKKEAEKSAKIIAIRTKLTAEALSSNLEILKDPGAYAKLCSDIEAKVVLQYEAENPTGRAKSDGHDGRAYTPQEKAQVAVFVWTQEFGKNMTKEQVIEAWKFAIDNPKAPRAKTKSVNSTTPPVINEIPE